MGHRILDRTSDRVSMLLVTEGMYLGIFDRLSPANTSGRWKEALEEGRKRAEEVAGETIYGFNEYWHDLARLGQILVWTFPFDGVFRVDAWVVSNLAEIQIEQTHGDRFVAQRSGDGRLSCPSGEIMVQCLGQLGQEDLQPVIAVPPGEYRVRLACDLRQVKEHSFLEDVDEYPVGDGPDWTVFLSWVP